MMGSQGINVASAAGWGSAEQHPQGPHRLAAPLSAPQQRCAPPASTHDLPEDVQAANRYSWDVPPPFNPGYVSVTRAGTPSAPAPAHAPLGSSSSSHAASGACCDDEHDVGVDISMCNGRLVVTSSGTVTVRGGAIQQLSTGDEIVSINGEMIQKHTRIRQALQLWRGKSASLVNVVVKKGGGPPEISLNLLRMRAVADSHAEEASAAERSAHYT